MCTKGEKRKDGDIISDALCENCEEGKYQKYDHSISTSCLDLTFCGPGTKLINANATAGPGKCHICPIGEFQSKDSHRHTNCKKWKTCGKGKKRIEGTTSLDAICETCERGTFQQLNSYANNTCTRWRRCSTFEVRVDGTSTQDATCESILLHVLSILFIIGVIVYILSLIIRCVKESIKGNNTYWNTIHNICCRQRLHGDTLDKKYANKEEQVTDEWDNLKQRARILKGQAKLIEFYARKKNATNDGNMSKTQPPGLLNNNLDPPKGEPKTRPSRQLSSMSKEK